MDKLLIVIFFLFFAFTFARTPLTQQENDITHIKLPESDATPTKQFDKETQHVQENQHHLPAPRGKKSKALPLTFVRLRPINRHFPVRSRNPSQPCHHHFHHAQNLKPRTQSTHLDDVIPQGNDMLLSSGDNNDFDHGGMHRVPEEWMRFLYHNNEDDDDVDDDDDDEEEQMMSKFIIKRNNHNKFGKLKLKDHLYDPFDEEEDEDDKISAMQHEDHHSFDKKKMKKHLHHHHEEEEQERKEGNEPHKEKKKTGGLVKHIRKLLDNYFD